MLCLSKKQNGKTRFCLIIPCGWIKVSWTKVGTDKSWSWYLIKREIILGESSLTGFCHVLCVHQSTPIRTKTGFLGFCFLFSGFFFPWFLVLLPDFDQCSFFLIPITDQSFSFFLFSFFFFYFWFWSMLVFCLSIALFLCFCFMKHFFIFLPCNFHQSYSLFAFIIFLPDCCFINFASIMCLFCFS